MSIKSDKWIRRMALERRMIEPFSDKQVREGVISYGLSSYGYDVRIADEFKIFTNINSTMVDPKSFDPRSFVDFRGGVCIIPPNSFALARTVEYFRIPRNVLTICVGKCLAGDTQVIDASSGRLEAISDLVSRGSATASVRQHAIGRADITEGARQGRLPVYAVRTGSGRTIRATPNHPLLTFSGWQALQDLRPGDRVGVPNRIPIFGSRIMPEWEVELLGLLALNSPQKFVPARVFELRPELTARFLRALFSGDGGISISGDGIHVEFSTTSERLARDVHHLLLRFGVVAMLRWRSTASGRGCYVLCITSKEHIRRFASTIGFTPGCRKQRKLEHALDLIEQRPQQKSNFDTLPREAWQLLKDACAVRGESLRSMGIERTQPSQSLPRPLARDLAQRLSDERLGAVADSDILWDTIREIRFAGVETVYDLSLPDTANFVANDIIVHNSTYARCGIIVNVTPFEPEWEGIVTLEVSNTTPLPAKIYANEGIAQVLFFESDEECETSYADKKGKYQAQKVLTLPRL